MVTGINKAKMAIPTITPVYSLSLSSDLSISSSVNTLI